MLYNKEQVIEKTAKRLMKTKLISSLPVPHKAKRMMAFTLAEVLLALLVIGVVAALVIPGIVSDSKEAEYKTAYKKAFAVASQIYQQLYSEGVLESRIDQYDGVANSNNFDLFMAKFSIQKQCINSDNGNCWDSTGEKSNGTPNQNTHAFIDSSGVAWSARCPAESGTCGSSRMMVDTNGFKKPNKFGKDRWMFDIFAKNNSSGATPIKIRIPNDFENVNDGTYCPNGATTPCYYKKWLQE